jgi:tetraacyldisaccharide 4'-kinase
VFVARQRAEAGRALLAAHPEVDVLVCDDGLQHYALARDVEVAVVDSRASGNGRLLPAGPLREPWVRLAEVDAVVLNLGAKSSQVDSADDSHQWEEDAAAVHAVPRFSMHLAAGDFYALLAPAHRRSAAQLQGRTLHALAGIGVPERFFATLRSLGLQFQAHQFPDHHAFALADLAFAEGACLLMTEKDAVKCVPLFTADTPIEAWVLPVSAQVTPDLLPLVLEKINGRQTA